MAADAQLAATQQGQHPHRKRSESLGRLVHRNPDQPTSRSPTQRLKTCLPNRARVQCSAVKARISGATLAAQRTVSWTVYILRCRDGSLYTGATNDLGRRFV